MNDVISSEPTVEVANEWLSKLRVFNTVMGFLHLASGVAMVALGNDFELEVSTFALNGPPRTNLADGTMNRTGYRGGSIDRFQAASVASCWR